jgi:hypothetical protein
MHLLGICILLVLLFLMILLTKEKKEGFDDNIGRVIPIRVSDDQNQIDVPNTINSHNGQPLQFSGDINTTQLNVNDLQVNDRGTMTRLFVDNNATINTVTINQPVKVEGSQLLEFGADTGKSWDGNGSISYKTGWDGAALNIVGAENGGPRKVHVWDDVEVNGNLHVDGTITIGPNNQKWSLTARDNGWIDFLHNDTSRDDYGGDVGHTIISPDGNLWLARSTYPGWIADNEQAVNSARDDKITAERQAEAQRQEDLWQQIQDAFSGGGGGCVIS